MFALGGLFTVFLALAIPFSARAMTCLRHPCTQDQAAFMHGAVLVLLLVAAPGILFGSEDQKFFLAAVWQSEERRLDLLRNGVCLAFIPVCFEGACWLLELSREDPPAQRSAGHGRPYPPARSLARRRSPWLPRPRRLVRPPDLRRRCRCRDRMESSMPWSSGLAGQV